MTSSAETSAALAAARARSGTAGPAWPDAAQPPLRASWPGLGDPILAQSVRALVQDAGPGGNAAAPVGMVDAATVLWTRFLKFDAADPFWPDRDRCLLSAAFGGRLQRVLLHLSGHAGYDPDADAASDHAAEPPGQGLGMAVGMALAERLLAARFGRSLVDHRTWVLACTGDLAQGVSHEAATLAGHLRLDRLTVLWEDAPGADGDFAGSHDNLRRFAAYGWATKSVDGQDHAALAAAFGMAVRSRKPTLIACRTSSQSPWQRPPVPVLEATSQIWRAVGQRGLTARRGWLKRLAHSAHRDEFERVTTGRLPASLAEALDAIKSGFVTERRDTTTRAASERVLAGLASVMPEMVGGSADPADSGGAQADLSPASLARRFLHFGIREHGMAAAMNGMAAHGGLLPYGGSTGLVSDAIRPALRLAALMRSRVVHVLTHDTRAVAAGGPAQLPVEQLASLRAVPNLHVLRPADAVETAECWELALRRDDGPSLLVVGRDAAPVLRDASHGNRCAEGGYVLAEADGPRRATLIATGGEVALALAARARLAAERVAVAVVSLPCWDLFVRAGTAHQARVLGDAMRFGIEAGSSFGWERWLGPDGVFMGREDFSAAPELTPEAIAATVRRCLAA